MECMLTECITMTHHTTGSQSRRHDGILPKSRYGSSLAPGKEINEQPLECAHVSITEECDGSVHTLFSSLSPPHLLTLFLPQCKSEGEITGAAANTGNYASYAHPLRFFWLNSRILMGCTDPVQPTSPSKYNTQ